MLTRQTVDDSWNRSHAIKIWSTSIAGTLWQAEWSSFGEAWSCLLPSGKEQPLSAGDPAPPSSYGPSPSVKGFREKRRKTVLIEFAHIAFHLHVRLSRAVDADPRPGRGPRILRLSSSVFSAFPNGPSRFHNGSRPRPFVRTGDLRKEIDHRSG